MRTRLHPAWPLLVLSLLILAWLVGQAGQRGIDRRKIARPVAPATNTPPATPSSSSLVQPDTAVDSSLRLLPSQARAMDAALVSLLATAEAELRKRPGIRVAEAACRFASWQAVWLEQTTAGSGRLAIPEIPPEAIEQLQADAPPADFTQALALARGLLCLACLNAGEARLDKAFVSVCLALDLAGIIARDGGRGPRLQGYTLALNLQRAALSTLRLLAIHHPEPRLFTRQVWQLLEETSARELPLTELLRFQERFQTLLLSSGRLTGLPGLPPMLREALDYPFVRRGLSGMLAAARPLLTERYRLLEEILTEESVETPGQVEAFYRENEEQWSRSLIRRRQDPSTYLAWSVVLSFLPPLRELLQDRERWRMERDLTLGYLELVCHLCEGGPLPSDLAALPHGDELPRDPCSPDGSPFRIQWRHGRLCLVGNGLDGRDDGGVAGRDFIVELPDELYKGPAKKEPASEGQ